MGERGVQSYRYIGSPLALALLRCWWPELDERIRRLGQRPQSDVEAVGAGAEEDVVQYRPDEGNVGASATGGRCSYVVVVIFGPDRRTVGPGRDKDFAALQSTPQAGEAGPVAEGVDEDAGVEGGGAEVDEGGEPAEEGRVGELEEGAEQDGQPGRVRVGEGEFVEVVDVGDGEVERGEEDEFGRG